MKKLILIPLLLLFSCREDKRVQPIEKYREKGIIVIEKPSYYLFGVNSEVRVKTKDSVFSIFLAQFDAKDLKPGDTIN